MASEWLAAVLPANKRQVLEPLLTKTDLTWKPLSNPSP